MAGEEERQEEEGTGNQILWQEHLLEHPVACLILMVMCRDCLQIENTLIIAPFGTPCTLPNTDGNV